MSKPNQQLLTKLAKLNAKLINNKSMIKSLTDENKLISDEIKSIRKELNIK